MASGVVAALIATLMLGFVEGMGRFYPAHRTWVRLRSRHGRRAIRAMRERLDSAAEHKTGRTLALILLGLVAAWVAAAGLLDKRWYEVLLDVTPYLLIAAAFFRVSPVLGKIAERMKEYERDVGEDPDRDVEDGGPTAIAL
jgi:hypothetical protein